MYVCMYVFRGEREVHSRIGKHQVSTSHQHSIYEKEGLPSITLKTTQVRLEKEKRGKDILMTK